MACKKKNEKKDKKEEMIKEVESQEDPSLGDEVF